MSAEEAVVWRVVESWNAAFAANDVERYFAFLDPDVVVLTASNPYRVEGRPDDRAEFAFGLDRGHSRVGYFEEVAPLVRIIGDVAIVTYFNRGWYGPEGGGQMVYLKETNVLARASVALVAGGRLVVDVVNPLALPLRGDPVPAPFLRRRHEGRNRAYTRFAALGPAAADQRQQLYGWYDEIDETGLVRRTPYSMWWRLIFRADSAKLFVVARESGRQGSVGTLSGASSVGLSLTSGPAS